MESLHKRITENTNLLVGIPSRNLICSAFKVGKSLRLAVWALPPNLRANPTSHASDVIVRAPPTEIVPTPSIELQPTELIPSPDGAYVAIRFAHADTLAVISLASCIRDTVLMKPGHIVSANACIMRLSDGHNVVNSEIIHAVWHPLSTHHICTLTADQHLRVFDIATAPQVSSSGVAKDRSSKEGTTKAVFDCDLRACGGRDFVTFCFAERSSSPWAALAAVLVDAQGSPAVLFPVAPVGLIVPPEASAILIRDASDGMTSEMLEWFRTACDVCSDDFGRAIIRFRRSRKHVLHIDPAANRAGPNVKPVHSVVLLHDAPLRLVAMCVDGSVIMRECYRRASLQWLLKRTVFNWTQPLACVAFAGATSLQPSTWDPSGSVVVVNPRIAHVVRFHEDGAPSCVVSSRSGQAIPGHNSGAVHWVNGNKTQQACFTIKDSYVLCYALLSPRRDEEQPPSNPDIAPLELPPLAVPHVPDVPQVPEASKNVILCMDEFVAFVDAALACLKGLANCNRFFCASSEYLERQFELIQTKINDVQRGTRILEQCSEELRKKAFRAEARQSVFSDVLSTAAGAIGAMLVCIRDDSECTVEYGAEQVALAERQVREIQSGITIMRDMLSGYTPCASINDSLDELLRGQIERLRRFKSRIEETQNDLQ